MSERDDLAKLRRVPAAAEAKLSRRDELVVGLVDPELEFIVPASGENRIDEPDPARLIEHLPRRLQDLLALRGP
ncbi:MAG TPA: hypothetical protein VFN55_04380 [Solirubrobacteraceae bacterium]|nr:hypothetical protein [Solirubrobacteraceae bacterium]